MVKREGDPFENGDWVTIIKPREGENEGDWYGPGMDKYHGTILKVEEFETGVNLNFRYLEYRYSFNERVRHFRHSTRDEIIRQCTQIGMFTSVIMNEITTYRGVTTNHAYGDIGIPSVKKSKSNPILIGEHPKNGIELFKYFPVYYSGMKGFYNKENCTVTFLPEKGLNDLIIYTEKQFPLELVIKYFSLDVLVKYCKFKIKDYKSSGKLFSNSSKKAKLVGQLVTCHSFEFDVVVPKSDKPVNTVMISLEEGGNLKMDLNDVEIIYPNIKGYHVKKDKSLFRSDKTGQIIDIKVKSGESLLVYKNKGMNSVKKNDVIVVDSIKKLGNNLYVSFQNSEGRTQISNIKQFKKLQSNVTTKKSVEKESKPGISSHSFKTTIQSYGYGLIDISKKRG